jgi:hypothetical protein
MHAVSLTAESGAKAVSVPPMECTAAPAPFKQVLADVAAATGIKRQRYGNGHEMYAESEQLGVDIA